MSLQERIDGGVFPSGFPGADRSGASSAPVRAHKAAAAPRGFGSGEEAPGAGLCPGTGHPLYCVSPETS